jgi:hypothetical protein
MDTAAIAIKGQTMIAAFHTIRMQPAMRQRQFAMGTRILKRDRNPLVSPEDHDPFIKDGERGQ